MAKRQESSEPPGRLSYNIGGLPRDAAKELFDRALSQDISFAGNDPQHILNAVHRHIVYVFAQYDELFIGEPETMACLMNSSGKSFSTERILELFRKSGHKLPECYQLPMQFVYQRPETQELSVRRGILKRFEGEPEPGKARMVVLTPDGYRRFNLENLDQIGFTRGVGSASLNLTDRVVYVQLKSGWLNSYKTQLVYDARYSMSRVPGALAEPLLELRVPGL